MTNAAKHSCYRGRSSSDAERLKKTMAALELPKETKSETWSDLEAW
jgi:hypothetical protein